MNFLQRLLLAVSLVALAACGSDEPTNPGNNPAPIPQPPPPPPPPPPAREWTVMVYLAADNNLAVDGIFDIDEMEAAGVDPRVQTVVQAEFSPSQLAQYGCGPECFNRPNFNTFRYALTGEGAEVHGPNGATEDIGNVDMTDPAQLNAFVRWAKEKYPARKYLLVLWNHGGGYVGLLQDETSAGSDLMSVEEMRIGLAGVGPIDVIDFDMCLMAGYETLVKLQGVAGHAVFSQEVVPGEGNPYGALIDGLQENPAMDGRAAAAMIVERFDAAYRNHKASTTKSAYALAGLPAFEQAVGALADVMRTNVAALAPQIGQAAYASQKFAYSELTDIVSFLDSLGARSGGNATLQQAIASTRTAATSAEFRVGNRVRNGNGGAGQAPLDVRRATGLHVVLPSGIGQDIFSDHGVRSLAAYQTLYAGKPWTSFLTAYAESQRRTEVVDQRNARFETYLIWDPAAVDAEVDIDLWVLEPNGRIYIPAFGSVSPNGTFSSDSEADGVNFEGYLTNRYVQGGEYRIFANLWNDPHNFRPQYDLAYRSNQKHDFSLLYAPDFPRLSTKRSWLDDPDPTLEKVEAGAYTDLQLAGTATIGAAGAQRLARPGSDIVASGITRDATPRVTAAQMATLRSLVMARRAPRARNASPGIGRRLWDGPSPRWR